MLKKLTCCCMVFGCFLAIKGQEIKPRGYFSKDTLKVGEIVDYTLILDYPRGMEVLFPDSTFQFTPFEYIDRSFVRTESNLLTSHDSVVYQLSTFELDSVQHLALPIFLITDGDSTTIRPPTDSIALQLLITATADSLAIKDTAQYQNVRKAFNYPYLIIALAALLILVLVSLAIFGKQIRTKLRLYRMRRAHEKFALKFAQLQSSGLLSAQQAEHLLGYWKKYLEKLDGMPYTKLTTKEIVTIGDNLEFKETLHSMDSNIYGQYDPPLVDQLSSKLKQLSVERYLQKIEEVKHV